MCMLYGFSGDRRYELNKSLKDFFSYSHRHPHGWGLAVYNSQYDKPKLIKEPITANSSAKVKELVERSLPGKLVIGHIRYATAGELSYVNTHPFVKEIRGESWTLAHNGSIEAPEFGKLKIKAEGQCDSEKIFCYLIQELKDQYRLEIEDKIRVLEGCIKRLSRYGKLNLIISDGTHMFVHSNYANSLYSYESNGVVCFTTTPLSHISKNKWKNVELNRLLVYKEGQEIYKGDTHRNQYYRIGRDYSEGLCVR